MRIHFARVPSVAAPVAAVKPVRGHPAVRAILRTPIQAKLEVGAVDDPLEHEADRLADQVLRMPAPKVSAVVAPPRISRKCAACEEGEGQETLQRKVAGPQSAADEALNTVHDVLRSPGRPLDDATRAYFEPRFGHDFSGVRVHTGALGEQSARDVNARAYTVGHNIVFGAGRFAPATRQGRRLIAHELAHVVQQSGADGARTGENSGNSGLSPVSTALSSVRRIQRDPDASADPVIELKQVGDVWNLKLQGFTDAKAVGRRIWPSGVPAGVKITPLVVVKKPAKAGLFKLTGVTLKAVDTMASPFASWFTVSGISWTADDLKNLLDACDGGLGIWAKAKKANKGKNPKITLGDSSNTDSLTGEITLDKKVDQCHAVQALIHELLNLSSMADVNKIIASATAGDVNRDEFIKRVEKIEYDVGVKNVLAAFDACKDKWLCKTSIMEFARKAKDFDDYFKNLVLPTHKEGYGTEWDKRFKKAYDKKHP